LVNKRQAKEIHAAEEQIATKRARAALFMFLKDDAG
jgi:hypothetical protein